MTTPTPADAKSTKVQSNAFGCITIPFLLIAMIPLGGERRTNGRTGR